MFRALSLLLFAPHIMLYLSSPSKEVITNDLYAKQEAVNASALGRCVDLASELMNSRYFRTLFYFRTHGNFTKVLRIFYPKCRSFIIDVNTVIGSGLRLAHPYSTILNAESIGENCYINHLVTVGEKNGRRPVIGNNVELHANCTVIGGITVGNHAVIGAGAVVVKDVPANAVVIGNPASIILNNV